MGRQTLVFCSCWHQSRLCQCLCFPRRLAPRNRFRSIRRLCDAPKPRQPDASVAELEKRGDTLRAEKAYLDALDYYRAAIAKEPNNAKLYNKIGINELQMARFNEARKDFRTGDQE